MPQDESNILILKPTANFVSFIASQINHIDLPPIQGLPTDFTAYSIRKCLHEEDILDEVERFFPLMFKHESSRLIGQELSKQISGTFLDFLCCFKFELHTEVILMEACMDEGNQLLCVKPRSVVLQWIESQQDDQIDVSELLKETIDLSHLTENTTVLVKNFDDASEITPFIKHHYRPIVKAEKGRLLDDAAYLPAVNSYKLFSRYFDVKIHSQLIHLH